MADGAFSIWRIAMTAVQTLVFALLIGIMLSEHWLARFPSAWQAEVQLRLAAVFKGAAIVMLVSGGLAFWIHGALMGEVPLFEAWPAVHAMLAETDFGRAWAAGAVFTLGLVGAAFVPVRHASPGLRLACWLGLAGVALSRSHMGHPVDAGAFGLPVWVDWVHLLAIGVWTGVVVVSGCLVLPGMRNASVNDRAGLAAYLRALSTAVTGALIALLATGVYNGWRAFGSPHDIVASTYGQLLTLKVGLVIVAVALGGYNRLAGMPGLLALLEAPKPALHIPRIGRFVAVLHIEAGVLAAALFVASVLAGSPLPGAS